MSARSPLSASLTRAASCLALAACCGCGIRPELSLRNVGSAAGGELFISGTGFTPRGKIRIDAEEAPGGGSLLLGFAEAIEDGALRDFRYLYKFARPYRGEGCPVSARGAAAGRPKQPSLPLAQLKLVVRAYDSESRHMTRASVRVPDCSW